MPLWGHQQTPPTFLNLLIELEKEDKAMAKHLLIWNLDASRVPVDPKERGAGWEMLMAMVKQDMEKGIVKD